MSNYEFPIVIGYAIVSFAFFYLAAQTSKTHGMLQLGFLGAGLIMVVVTAGLADEVAAANTAPADVIAITRTGLIASTYIMYMGMAYILITLIVEVIKFLVKQTKSRRVT